MAIAGKVAITPGGEWSVDFAYDKLVVVTFGNNVYLSIKPSTGIEPTNEEHWMLLIENVTQEQYDNIINGTTTVGNALQLGGKGASEYALIGSENLNTSVLEKALAVSVGVHNYQLGGSNYTGRDLPSTEYAWGTATIYKRNETSISVELHNEGKNFVSINSFNGVQWTGWGRGATKEDLANYLPLSGGVLYGNLSIQTDSSESKARGVYFKNADGTTNYGAVGLHSANGVVDYLYLGVSYRKSENLAVTKDTIKWHDNDLLHTGNKPTGSYTGNGDATSRDITTGGIGKACLVYSEKGAVLVDAKGGVGHTSGGTYKVFKYTETKKETNYLRVATTDDLLNASGVEYTYQVL